MTCSGIRIVVK